MKRGNILDIGMKAIRDSGLVNMFDRKGIQRLAFDMGFCELVTWLEEAKNGEHIMLLESVDFENTANAPLEELLEVSDMGRARLILMDEFEEQIKSYRGGFLELKRFPFSFDDFTASPFKGLRSFVDQHVEDHPLNYILILEQGDYAVQFTDGFYVTKGGNVTKLSSEMWKIEQELVSRMPNENRTKFHYADKYFRLHTLFQ